MGQANEAVITFFGQQARVGCDRQCGKAWGISQRPKVQLSDDENDIVWLADGELGEAPADPGTSEGGHGKPLSPDDFPNKWCVRECERSAMSDRGKFELPLVLPDFSRRLFNQPGKHAGGSGLTPSLFCRPGGGQDMRQHRWRVSVWLDNGVPEVVGFARWQEAKRFADAWQEAGYRVELRLGA